MLLVIFGAGASHDSAGYASGEGGSHRPPLAKDLVGREFDDIAVKIRRCRPVIDRLRERMATAEPEPLESALARLSGDSGGSAERRQQLVAFRFYLHRVIEDTVTEWLRLTAGYTHYLRLFNALYDWHVKTAIPIRMATFNYDVMLEEAITDVLGWEFDSLLRYIERDDFRVFKLHGSTNWSRLLPTLAHEGVGGVHAAMDLARHNAAAGGEIMCVRPELQVGAARSSTALQDSGDREVMMPALAVPMAAKTEFECPEEHLRRLRVDLPEITHVLIIGWRAAEPHAVELLAGPDPTAGLMPGYALGIVDLASSGIGAVKDNLGEVGRRGVDRLAETGGFSAFIQHMSDYLDGFLER